MLNKIFFQSNFNYTKEIAEKRLSNLGYKNFCYKGCSFAHGASFYFEGENGKEIRVSDHNLMGKRSDECIQIRIVEPKVLPVWKK